MEYEKTSEPWPVVNLEQEIETRIRRLASLRDPSGGALMKWKGKLPAERWKAAKQFYKGNPHSFIRHWGVTSDPRKVDAETPALLPFVPFKRQREMTSFVYDCLKHKQPGLIEKSRDMGATWDCSIISVHLWLFWDGASVSWGSRKSQLVDRLGDPDSIFEKIRIQLRNLPPELMPDGFKWDDHVNYMRIVNPQTGATIAGEAGDEIGRGGRSSIYFVDEAAHLEHPESIEASLNSNTECRIDISSVGAPGNVFHRRREAGIDYDPAKGITEPDALRTYVFVMDWRHHPGKSQKWYDGRKQKAEDEGLLHVHAQEVDRDYSASIQGTIIPAAWVKSAIDAHIILKFKATQVNDPFQAALDVADGDTQGADRNAFVLKQGPIIRYLDEWGERDTGRTARKAIQLCEFELRNRRVRTINLQFDVVGVGSGVKAEANRLKDDKLMPKWLRFVPWNGGFTPMWPDRRVIPDDKDTPFNKDFYMNLKAQGWWQLRRRFELTFKAVSLVQEGQKLFPHLIDLEPREYARLGAVEKAKRESRSEEEIAKADTYNWDEEDLVSLPKELPKVWKLVKELSQPVAVRNTKMKLLVDKTPEGTMSPNMGDVVMMAFWPIDAAGFSEEDMTDTLVKMSEEPKRKPSLAPRPRNQRPAPKPAELPPAQVQVERDDYHEVITHTVEESPKLPRGPQLRTTRPPAAPVQVIK